MVPLDVMPLNGVGHTFTVLRREPGSIALGKLVNILKFRCGSRASPRLACPRHV